jgi:hypothetical protein
MLIIRFIGDFEKFIFVMGCNVSGKIVFLATFKKPN